MRLVCFAVYDVKSESYGPPFVCRTIGEGLRFFEDMLNDAQGSMFKHRGDYRLFRVGEYEPSDGVLFPEKSGPILLEDGLQLVKEG